MKILTINGGSSSIKFALFESEEDFKKIYTGNIESIGAGNPLFSFTDFNNNKKDKRSIDASDFEKASEFLLQHLSGNKFFDNAQVVGHRIVHGMGHEKPAIINEHLLNELRSISNYDPDHLPAEILLIEKINKKYPELMQVACFDTSFHTSMPLVAKLLPIPRRYYDLGIQRYGFHGLSYSYLMEELNRKDGNKIANEKIILAHLGNGASLAAIKDGKSIDTSMGFTPTAGVPMSTRTGDLDPGVASYLIQEEKLSTKEFNHLINHESGLLGISETNSDMRELIKLLATDNRADEAIELFCYQTKKWIGAYAAVLGGLDTLVFSGGIGENAPEVRRRVCNGLQFLGIELDEKRNADNEEIISADDSKVTVRVIKTNEELMIARLVCDVLDYSVKQ